MESGAAGFRSSSAFLASDRRGRAFFITYGASHVAKVAPVVRELQAVGVECRVMALTIGYKRAIQLGLEPLGYKDFLHLADDPEAVLSCGRSLMAGNVHPDVDEHETCCYLGTNYQEWVSELGPDGAAARYAERGRQGFMPVRFMGKVIDELQPGVVVATSTPRSEEAGIRAAIARGIPTLTMVDLFAPPSDPFLRRPVQADRITVVSEEVRARFLGAGLGADQVVVTGSPDFDILFDPGLVRSGADFRRRMGWEGLTVMMWAGILEPSGAAPEHAGSGLGILVERELRRWVATRHDVALVVRYHPSQYHEFPTQPSQDRVYVSNSGAEPISALLHASDVVINQLSTVGFEAALLRKRVLHLAFSAWVVKADFDLSSFGASEPVESLDALVPALETPAPDPAGRKMTLPQGPAAPRVAAEVLRLLQK
jgi:hypothetical protein